MKRNFIFTMCLVMGLNVFAQNQVFKAMPSAEVKNFKVAETQPKQRFSAKSSVRNYVNHYVESEAFYTTYDLPRSFVVCSEKGKTTVYVTQYNTSTLIKREMKF
mgnify:CR=1 FL=1